MILIIIFGILLLLYIVSTYQQIRVDVIMRQRLRLMEMDRKAFDNLPSYEYYVCRFWIWKIPKPKT
jgi:hypothetical protein